MPTTTFTLTAEQASYLTALNAACTKLAKKAKALAVRTQDILDRTENGQWLTGFETDVLGQEGREVQHYASVRHALIGQATGFGIPGAVLAEVLKPATFNGLGGRYFAEGEII